MGNPNNDISLFKKIVFVDNIPNENLAKELSIKYPFCIFLTDENNTGVNGITEEFGDIGASSNMWKNGHRLTKFINVDPNNNNIVMDTYSIRLTFDNETGLLGLKAVQKIENFKLIGIVYKKPNNEWKTFINKGDTQESNGYPFDNYGNISFINSTYNFETIDAVNNKLYFIIRYTASDIESLNSVPFQSFNIIPSDSSKEYIEIIGNPDEPNTKFANILQGDPNSPDIINYINHYTYAYSDESESFYRDIVYEVQLKNNVLSNSGGYTFDFSFGGLKDIFTSSLLIRTETAYVNPQSFKLMINNTDIHDASDPSYLMPSDIGVCTIKMTPSNVRPLQLQLSNLENGFINAANSNSIFYNGNEGGDTITFYVGCPSDFAYDPDITHQTQNTSIYDKQSPLSFEIKNKIGEGDTSFNQYTSPTYTLRQYRYNGLELNSNPWTPYGIVTSGEQIGFNTYDVYAKFINWDDHDIIKTKKISTNDNGMTVRMTEVSPQGNCDSTTINIPNTLTLGTGVSFNAPWINQTSYDQTDQNKTADYICVEYSYHGYTDNTSHRKYIKADTLKEVHIMSNGVNSIAFEQNVIESGATVNIVKRSDVKIEFVYNNGQIVDGYKWGCNNQMSELKNHIIIGLEGSQLNETDRLGNVTNGKIPYQSNAAREHDNVVIAKLKFGDKISTDYISVTVSKLVIEWYIYIGEYTLNGDRTDVNSPAAITDQNIAPSNGNDPAWEGTNTNGIISVPASTDGDFTFYKGGWIYLGLKDDVKQRGSNNPLWEFSDDKLIMTANDMTDNTKTSYLIISPVGITWEDAFGTTEKDASIILPQRQYKNDIYNMTVVPQEFMFGMLKGFNYRLYYKANT